MSTCRRPFFSCLVWMALIYFPQLVPGLLPASQPFSTGLLLTATRPGGSCQWVPFLHCGMVPRFRTRGYRLWGTISSCFWGNSWVQAQETGSKVCCHFCQPGQCSLASGKSSLLIALVFSFAKTSGLGDPCTQGFLFLTIFSVTLPWVLQTPCHDNGQSDH